MFRRVSVGGFAGTVGACLLHYAVFGRKRWRPDKSTASVYRFSLSERLVHATTLLAFIVLAGTGFWTVLALRSPLHGWLWVSHAAAGAIFAIATALMALFWAMDCRFARHDWTWVRRLGGYLGGSNVVPAGRFNAGQKAFFWVSVLLGLVTLLSGLGRMTPVLPPAHQELIYEIHRYGALLFVMSVAVHFYLATVANRGTIRSMVLGTVGSEWARHHHPLWLEENGGSSDAPAKD